MSGLSIDLTITAGNIIEICVLSGGGLFALSKFTTKFALLAQEFIGMKADIIDVKSDLRKVNEILAQANETARRVGRVEDEVRDLRHGRGFVRGETGIDREYGAG